MAITTKSATPVKVSPVKIAAKAVPVAKPVTAAKPAAKAAVATPKAARKEEPKRGTVARGGSTVKAAKIEDMETYTQALAKEIADLFDADLSFDLANNNRTWFIKGKIHGAEGTYDASIFITNNKGDNFRVILERPAFWSRASFAYDSRERVVQFFTALLLSEEDAGDVPVKVRTARDAAEEE